MKGSKCLPCHAYHYLVYPEERCRSSKGRVYLQTKRVYVEAFPS